MSSSPGVTRTEQRPSSGSSLDALRSPAFRLYFGGQLVSVSGTWMQTIAQQVVVYNLTHSELALGLVACAQGLPSLVVTPIAGVFIERYPRKQVLIGAQAAMMVLAFIMAALQFTNSLMVWHIVALSFALGIANAVDATARNSFVVDMVGKENLSSGIVLNSILFNMARVVGPALGGIALATIGPAWCFLLNGASFFAVLLSLFVMVVPHVGEKVMVVRFFQPLKEGLDFSRKHQAIWPLLLLSSVTSVFGITFAVLIPAFADQVLHDTDTGTAALSTAWGIGAILAGIFVARLNSGGRRGRIMVISALFAPLAVILFAFSPNYLMSLPVVTLSGFGFIAEYILLNTLLQTLVPDEYRGRVLSLYTLTFLGFQPFSSLVLGVLAEKTSTVAGLLAYGVIGLILTAVIFWRAPQLRHLD